jgi:hypothetical protein
MSASVTNLLRTVEVTEPRETGGLQVFGLRWQSGNGLSYTTLDDALAEQALEVTEVSEGGSVPTLKVHNKGGTMVFLMAGEQLVGAKQNRVLNASIMVAGQSELPIPVTCVEAGRWRYRSHTFSSSGTTSHSLLRAQMCKQSSDSYCDVGTPSSDQGAVWGEVSRKLHAMKSDSASAALYQAYEDHQARLNDLLEKLPAPEDCCGAVFAFGGQIAGVDLFDKPATLGKLWPKLIRGYAIDALEQAGVESRPVPREAVCQWLERATGANAQPYKSPGLGEDVRLQGDGLVGAGLVVEDHPVHVELFAQTVA